MIKNLITDPATGRHAAVVNHMEQNALVVATRSLKEFRNDTQFFINDVYGVDMNQDAGFTGTPIPIHNGIDATYWTASAITGTWVFDSIAQAHSGTQSIDATATIDNSTAQIAKGSSQDLTGHVAVTGWIYITTFAGASGMILYGWDTGTNNMVGNEVNIGDFVSTITLGEWQQFAIPLENMGLEGDTIDAFRVRTQRGTSIPNYYLDDIQIEESGGSIEYVIQPELGEKGFASSINLTMIDAFAGTLAAATMPNIPYDSFLGVARLPVGILYREYQNNEVSTSYVMHQFSDLINFPTADLHSFGSDGTNTWFSLRFTLEAPLKLVRDNADRITITIQDDLTGLLQFRASSHILIEEESI